jgi:hypothetical protein
MVGLGTTDAATGWEGYPVTATTTPINGKRPADAAEAALCYLASGRLPIPIAHRGKKPIDPETGQEKLAWQQQRPTTADLPRLFPEGRALNVGILLGAPSGGLIDVDLDCAEAIAAAPLLLPQTGWVSGRKSRPRSHWWYEVSDPPHKAQDEYADLDGSVLLEVRSTGGQSVAPPGIHESGESIVWNTYTQPAHVEMSELLASARAVASVAILARHWPAKGQRDRAAMALSGGLVRAGWPAERVSLFCRAVAVAAGDEEARMRASKAAPTASKQEGGRLTTGWPILAKLLGPDGGEVVARVRAWLGLADQSLPEVPLPEPPPWPAPPGEEAFHGLPGRIVRTIEPVSEADPTALLVQVLVAFGNVIGRAAYFDVESDRHHANEFVVLVGQTSKARKGTSWGRVSGLFRASQGQWARERVQSGASSGEGIIWAVRDPIQKRECIKERGHPVRYEEVEADPGVADKRLLIYEPEFANVLKQPERKGNNLSAVLRQAWDGLDMQTLTRNSPARATGAHVSLIGHITADELRRYLTETEIANGYGNRHLWICTKRSKPLPEGGSVDARAWDALQAELAQALAFASSAGVVTRDEDARALWWTVYGPLSEGRPGLAGSLLARGEAHVMRLAMLYALMDRSATIGAAHLLAALALWDYVERSVAHIFGDALGDPVADEILRLLRSCPNGLTRTEIREYFQRNQSSDRIGRALGLLLQYRLARRQEVQTKGRPAERWYAQGKGQGDLPRKGGDLTETENHAETQGFCG